VTYGTRGDLYRRERAGVSSYRNQTPATYAHLRSLAAHADFTFFGVISATSLFYIARRSLRREGSCVCIVILIIYKYVYIFLNKKKLNICVIYSYMNYTFVCV